MVNYFYRSLSVALLLFLFSTGAKADIIGHWKFDEPSGTIAFDSINGNNGVYVANDDPEPGWQPGLIGGATGLNDQDNGIGEYFSIPSIPQMNGRGPTQHFDLV